ncbi:hypothetical protein SAMN04487783_0635 [Agrococcus baldri]|uniref:Uncharacterized protein n=2 Tax=Agrococcus baldri TaxID=153730 RepID=A0AA94HKX2_9MICO|nr:hypothetical protein SAMN04487783_0635 [Agrococcus baldri]
MERERAARAAALWTLLIGLIASALTGLSGASWLQGALRFGCAPAASGGGRAVWRCDDTMALLVPAIATTVLGVMAAAAMLLIVRASWQDPRGHAAALATAGMLAVVPAIVLSAALLWDASAWDAAFASIEASRTVLWREYALPALLALAAAGIVAAVGLRMRARGRPGRLGVVLVAAALALLLLAAALTSLGTLSTGLIAAGVIGSAWYLAAATPQGPREMH